MCRGSAADAGSTPGSLCFVSLPLSYPVSCHTLQLYYRKGQKILKKKKKWNAAISNNNSPPWMGQSCLKTWQSFWFDDRSELCTSSVTCSPVSSSQVSWQQRPHFLFLLSWWTITDIWCSIIWCSSNYCLQNTNRAAGQRSKCVCVCVCLCVFVCGLGWHVCACQRS